MKKKFFFDRKEKKLQMNSEENSFERCVLCGVVTDVPVQLYSGSRTAVQRLLQGTVWQR